MQIMRKWSDKGKILMMTHQAGALPGDVHQGLAHLHRKGHTFLHAVGSNYTLAHAGARAPMEIHGVGQRGPGRDSSRRLASAQHTVPVL
jgi:hypothetical protein